MNKNKSDPYFPTRFSSPGSWGPEQSLSQQVAHSADGTPLPPEDIPCQGHPHSHLLRWGRGRHIIRLTARLDGGGNPRRQSTYTVAPAGIDFFSSNDSRACCAESNGPTPTLDPEQLGSDRVQEPGRGALV